MSDSPVPDPPARQLLAPAVEFRRWLIPAFALTICGSVVFVTSFKLGRPLHEIAAAANWTIFGAVEGWVQFRSVLRRVIWIVATSLIGVALTWFWDWQETPFGWLIYLLPAALEFIAASGERKRPWVWIVVTVPLFGFASWWIGHLVFICDDLRSYVPVRVSGFEFTLVYHARNLAVILITRAIVGSFIASRKQV